MKRSPVRARALAKGYRSGLEEKVAESLTARGCPFTYEKHVVRYCVPSRTARYTPDVVLPNGIVVETKGLWDATDRKKVALVTEQFPDLELRMVFTRSSTPISKGSKTTYAMVCHKLGLRYTDKDIPSAWIEEPPHTASLALLKDMLK